MYSFSHLTLPNTVGRSTWRVACRLFDCHIHQALSLNQNGLPMGTGTMEEILQTPRTYYQSGPCLTPKTQLQADGSNSRHV